MWKFQGFSIIQIIREIDLGEFRSSEIAYITILGALNFENVVNFSLHKVQKFLQNQNSEPLNLLKWQILHI